MMGRSKMTIEEIEELVKYWENTIDGRAWSEEDRQLTLDAITQSTLTLAEWKAWLIKIPDNLEERYRKMMTKLTDERLITQEAFEYEMKVMDRMSPAGMAKRGREFADFYREHKSP